MPKLHRISEELAHRRKDNIASDIRVVLAYEDKLKEASTSSQGDVLRDLALDDNPLILERVASNINTLPETLLDLAKREEREIKLALVNNKSTPAEALTTLGRMKDEELVSAVACHLNTPNETLLYLIETYGNNTKIMTVLLAREAIDRGLLDVTSKIKNPFVQLKVAGHRDTSVIALQNIVDGTDDPYVLTAVAERQDAPSNILEQIGDRDNLTLGLMKALSMNPNTPIKMRRYFKSKFF